jgi:hypothetical protein
LTVGCLPLPAAFLTTSVSGGLVASRNGPGGMCADSGTSFAVCSIQAEGDDPEWNPEYNPPEYRYLRLEATTSAYAAFGSLSVRLSADSGPVLPNGCCAGYGVTGSLGGQASMEDRVVFYGFESPAFVEYRLLVVGDLGFYTHELIHDGQRVTGPFPTGLTFTFPVRAGVPASLRLVLTGHVMYLQESGGPHGHLSIARIRIVDSQGNPLSATMRSASGTLYGGLSSPIPEPDTSGLIALALGSLIIGRRKLA